MKNRGLPRRPKDWVGHGDLGVVCVLLDAQYLQLGSSFGRRKG